MATAPHADRRGGLPVLTFSSVSALEAWISEHVDEPGLWVKIAKAGSEHASVTYAEALDVALRFGWIDGHKVGHDEQWWLQRFTPRRPGSRWSVVNRDKAVALMAAGRMRPTGQAEVDAAQSNGRWDAAYAGQRTAEVPADLQAALDANTAAAQMFSTLTSTNRYAVIYRVESVKRPQTRARKIEQYVAMLAAGETIHPQARPKPV